MTTTIVGWVDIFTRKELREILIESLRCCNMHKGLNIFAYCVMSNHIHLIVNCKEPFMLKDSIQDFKRHTSTRMFEWIERNPESRKEWMKTIFTQAAKNDGKSKKIKLWKTGNHAIEF